MAYSDYTLSELASKFGIYNQVKRIFGAIQPVEPSDWLRNALEIAHELPIRSEKAKSELIVMPILIEMRHRCHKYITIYSGEHLNVNAALKGECDFIIAQDTGSFEINVPILQVVEAKKNDVEIGIPQCAAQMLGAQKYNEKKNKKTTIMYGCVTTGDDWLFMRLAGDTVEIDTRKYYLSDLKELLGIFQYIIQTFQAAEKATAASKL